MNYRFGNSAGRKALSLIELVVFLAIFSVLVGSVLPLMSMAIEHYYYQKSMSLVENNGAQLTNALATKIRLGEDILYPAPAGATGSALALQTILGTTSPLIIGENGGLPVAQTADGQENLMNQGISLHDLVFRNASTGAQKNVDISFKLSSTAGTPPRTYEKSFAISVTLFSIGRPQGNLCGCLPPTCPELNVFTWHTCTCNPPSCGPENCVQSSGSVLCFPPMPTPAP